MHFFNTTVTPQAIKQVNSVMESGYLSEGKVALRFEKLLHRLLGLHQVITVNSGTSALHLALVSHGIREGDEVITSPQTFIATALAILYCGARPVFADIDPFTGNLDPDSVRAKITDRTTAILPVMWAGYPSELDIAQLGFKCNIPVIADAAHALGATYFRKPVGGLSLFYNDTTCFSFQSIKALTTSDGGAICTLKHSVYERAKRLRWFGIDRESDKPDELGERQYTLTEIGFKHHLSDFNASLGIGNLHGFKDRLARRREIAKRYFTELANTPGLTLMRYKLDRESAYWLFPVLVESRLDFVRKLKECGVPTSVVHQRIDKHPIFGGKRTDLPGMDYFDAHQIHLPMHNALTDDDISLVVSTIKEGW